MNTFQSLVLCEKHIIPNFFPGNRLDFRSSKVPSGYCCLMVGLETCLLNCNLCFADMHLLEANSTATRVSDSCFYSDIPFNHLDKIINDKRTTLFWESFYFGRYCDDCPLKQSPSLSTKRKQMTRQCDNCPCELCKIYIVNVSFL